MHHVAKAVDITLQPEISPEISQQPSLDFPLSVRELFSSLSIELPDITVMPEDFVLEPSAEREEFPEFDFEPPMQVLPITHLNTQGLEAVQALKNPCPHLALY